MGTALNSEELLKDDPLNPQVPHLRVIGNSRSVAILAPASETTPSDHLPALSLKSRKRLCESRIPPPSGPAAPSAGPLFLSTLRGGDAPHLAPCFRCCAARRPLDPKAGQSGAPRCRSLTSLGASLGCCRLGARPFGPSQAFLARLNQFKTFVLLFGRFA